MEIWDKRPQRIISLGTEMQGETVCRDTCSQRFDSHVEVLIIVSRFESLNVGKSFKGRCGGRIHKLASAVDMNAQVAPAKTFKTQLYLGNGFQPRVGAGRFSVITSANSCCGSRSRHPPSCRLPPPSSPLASPPRFPHHLSWFRFHSLIHLNPIKCLTKHRGCFLWVGGLLFTEELFSPPVSGGSELQI